VNSEVHESSSFGSSRRSPIHHITESLPPSRPAIIAAQAFDPFMLILGKHLKETQLGELMTSFVCEMFPREFSVSEKPPH
jgi:hypothetical protein